MKKSSLLSGSLIWIGAAISLAEFAAGMLFAGAENTLSALCAILLGHLIGFILMYLCGIIGYREGKCAMDTAKIPFGNSGGKIFSALNLIQLIGWEAVMISIGSACALQICGIPKWLCAIIIGAFLVIWILLGSEKSGRLNIPVIIALALLIIYLSFKMPSASASHSSASQSSFGSLLELSIAMPLSWLPLISDYTYDQKSAKSPFLFSLFYNLTSAAVFLLGFLAAEKAGIADIAGALRSLGAGVIGIIIVILSTVITTYLDAHSGGYAVLSIFPKIPRKAASLAICLTGTLIAALFPAENMEDFLLFIGSVFTPMSAILICDYFILKHKEPKCNFSIAHFAVFIAGFISYRILLLFYLPIGSCIPAFIITFLLCAVFCRKEKRNEK